jgi:hypothetical protein
MIIKFLSEAEDELIEAIDYYNEQKAGLVIFLPIPLNCPLQ